MAFRKSLWHFLGIPESHSHFLKSHMCKKLKINAKRDLSVYYGNDQFAVMKGNLDDSNVITIYDCLNLLLVKTLTWWVWLLLCYRVQVVTALFSILLLLNMMTLCSWICPMAIILLRRTSAQHLHHCIFLVTQHGADHFSNIYSFLFTNMIASWCLSWMNPSPSSFSAACYLLIPL